MNVRGLVQTYLGHEWPGEATIEGIVLQQQNTAMVLSRLEQAVPAGADCGGMFERPHGEVLAADVMCAAICYDVSFDRLFSMRS